MPAIEFLKRYPSAALLGVQLLGFLLYPLMERVPSGQSLFGASGLVVLGAALWVVRRGPWLTWFGFMLAFVIVILSVISVFAPQAELGTVDRRPRSDLLLLRNG